MTRLLVLGALLLSLAVPGGALAILIVTETDSTPSTSDNDVIVDLHNDLIALAEIAQPNSAANAAEANRIAEEARAWQERWDATPEWEEFAEATAGLAALFARAIENPESVSEAEFTRAEDRIQAAEDGLPEDRAPTDG